VTDFLEEKRQEIAKRHGLQARVRLAFTPKRGKRLTKSVGISFS